MLSPLQEQGAEIVADLEEAKDFVLAGGAALIARGDVIRQTRDLDFFGLTPAAVDRLVPAVDRALQGAGLVVHHVQVNPAADARLFPAEPGRPAPMLRGEELAADKVLALFGRAEARDFVDLTAVEPRYGLHRLCRLAAEKDRGFRPAIFAEMLDAFRRLRRDEFGLDDASYEQLTRDIERWRKQALELARRQELEHDRGSDPGHEL